MIFLSLAWLLARNRRYISAHYRPSRSRSRLFEIPPRISRADKKSIRTRPLISFTRYHLINSSFKI